HPEVAERLAEEARTVLGDRIPTAADIKSLVYARQVFLETLRLFPPVWLIARRPDVDDEIAGYRVPKGTYLFIPTACIQRHPKHWPDPERFDPDRFAPDKPAPHRFAYFPFSRGQRQCIGDRFAEMEGVMALAMLGRAFKFETVPEKAWSIQLTMTQRPRDDLPLRLAAR
ncbi:MAG: cytochrome P450, partial [Anaerolineae bacterium]|nr:cytochrome P450 [Anaerolineae bacterium]